MTQLSMSFEAPPLADAQAMGQAGMQLAADRAEREEPGFQERAYRFLCWYAKLDDAPFPAEAVTELALSTGIEPPDGRAWGAVFQKAARAGVICRSSVTYKRAKGHGSLGVMWVAA